MLNTSPAQPDPGLSPKTKRFLAGSGVNENQTAATTDNRAKNPTKHAIFTSFRNLPDEDQRVFHKLFTQMAQSFKPRDTVEEGLVMNYTVETWQLHRIYRWEADILRRCQVRDDQHSQLELCRRYKRTVMNNLKSCLTQLRAYRDLKRMEAQLATELGGELPDFSNVEFLFIQPEGGPQIPVLPSSEEIAMMREASQSPWARHTQEELIQDWIDSSDHLEDVARSLMPPEPSDIPQPPGEVSPMFLPPAAENA